MDHVWHTYGIRTDMGLSARPWATGILTKKKARVRVGLTSATMRGEAGDV